MSAGRENQLPAEHTGTGSIKAGTECPVNVAPLGLAQTNEDGALSLLLNHDTIPFSCVVLYITS